MPERSVKAQKARQFVGGTGGHCYQPLRKPVLYPAELRALVERSVSAETMQRLMQSGSPLSSPARIGCACWPGGDERRALDERSTWIRKSAPKVASRRASAVGFSGARRRRCDRAARHSRPVENASGSSPADRARQRSRSRYGALFARSTFGALFRIQVERSSSARRSSPPGHTRNQYVQVMTTVTRIAFSR